MMGKILKICALSAFTFGAAQDVQATPFFIDLFTPEKKTINPEYDIITHENIGHFTVNVNTELLFQLTEQLLERNQSQGENAPNTALSPDAMEEDLCQLLTGKLKEEVSHIRSILEDFVDKNIYIEIKEKGLTKELLKAMKLDIVEISVNRIIKVIVPNFFNKKDLSSNSMFCLPFMHCMIRTYESWSPFFIKLASLSLNNQNPE